MLQQPIKEINFALTFGHSINPAYASIYFVYQYSLVYSCDLFSEFQKHGIMSKKIGKRYRKYILEPSGLNSGFRKMEDFLGRKPTEEAYLHMYGFE